MSVKPGRDASIDELIRDMQARKAGFIARARRDFKRNGMVVREPPLQPDTKHVLTRGFRSDVAYQVTRLDEHEQPMGHTEHGTLDAALGQLWDGAGVGRQKRHRGPAGDPVPRTHPQIVKGRLVRL